MAEDICKYNSNVYVGRIHYSLSLTGFSEEQFVFNIFENFKVVKFDTVVKVPVVSAAACSLSSTID